MTDTKKVVWTKFAWTKTKTQEAENLRKSYELCVMRPVLKARLGRFGLCALEI